MLTNKIVWREGGREGAANAFSSSSAAAAPCAAGVGPLGVRPLIGAGSAANLGFSVANAVGAVAGGDGGHDADPDAFDHSVAAVDPIAAAAAAAAAAAVAAPIISVTVGALAGTKDDDHHLLVHIPTWACSFHILLTFLLAFTSLPVSFSSTSRRGLRRFSSLSSSHDLRMMIMMVMNKGVLSAFIENFQDDQ